MMRKFTLAHPSLPQTVVSEDGNEYEIDSSFRTVLACLERFSDPDRNDVEKMLYLAAHFFKGNPPPDMTRLFTQFFVGEAAPEESSEPKMDFEQDADAIYSSFRQQYGIDLIHEDMHWRVFQMLLAGLGEATEFGSRLKIRGLDESDYTGKDRSKIRKIKDMVAIIPKMSTQEMLLQKELYEGLAEGKAPKEIIAKLQAL